MIRLPLRLFFIFFLILCSFVFISCDSDYLNGGECRVLLSISDYNLVYENDFQAVLIYKDGDTELSGKMIKSATGDGASAEFSHMKEGEWGLEIQVFKSDTVVFSSRTEVEVISRQISTVRGELFDPGTGLTINWNGSVDNLPGVPSLSLDDFQVFNIGATDFTPNGYGENFPLTLAFISGSQLENTDYFSISYPDGSFLESGTTAREVADGWFSYFADSSFIEIRKAGNMSAGETTLIMRDTNGNAYSMVNSVSGESGSFVFPDNIYPWQNETVYSANQVFQWQFVEDLDWIGAQFFAVADLSDGSIIDAAVLDSSVVSRSVTGLVSGRSYIFAVMAVDAGLDDSFPTEFAAADDLGRMVFSGFPALS